MLKATALTNSRLWQHRQQYYCDYCDTYLTHDSPSVRKTHCNGRKHKENVRLYYQKWLEEQVQKLVDDTTAAFKAGKIASNPFQSSQQSGGTMIPPPATLAGGTKPPAAAPPATPAAGPPVGGPVPGMSLMGPPPGTHLPPMMPTMTVGIRPPMGPPIGPPMAPMGTMVSAIPMRPPVMAGGGSGGPPPGKIARR